MPLSMAGVGAQCVIVHVGGSPKVRAHLQNLGFIAGEEVRVVSDIAGDLIVKIKDVRVAIAKDLASKILV
mgnify:CR=1 FL=1